MESLDERLKKLEENFGMSSDLEERAKRAGDWLCLTEYQSDPSCVSFIKERAEELVSTYGSVQAAISALGDVDLRDIERALTKEEKEEYNRLKERIGLL